MIFVENTLLAYATCTSDLVQPPIHPDTRQNIFPKCIEKLTHSRCLKRMPGSHCQASQVPLTPAHQFLFCRQRDRPPHPDSRFSPRYTQFSPFTGSSLDLDFPLDFALDLLQWLLLMVMCLNHCLRHLLRLRLLLLDLLLRLLIVPARAVPVG